MRFLISFLLFFLLAGCRGLPSTKDAEESARLWQAVVSKYHFRVLAKHGDRPAVYEIPGSNYSKIMVYGEYSTQEQDEIYRAVAAAAKGITTKPVRLCFYPVELRDENLLREEVIPGHAP
jgi:hypothetical protein